MINTALRTSLTAVAFAAAVSTSAVAGPLPLFPFEPLPARTARAARHRLRAGRDRGAGAGHDAPSRFKRQVVNYRPTKRRAPSSSTPRTPISISCSAAARRSATASASAARASPGRASRPSRRRPSGRTGIRRRRCSSVSPICRASWPAAPATRSAPAPCISPARSTASTAPTRRRPSASACRRAASASNNEDVQDLYERVKVGAKVVVLPMNDRRVSHRSGFSTN